jgi:DNA helicase MCM8
MHVLYVDANSINKSSGGSSAASSGNDQSSYKAYADGSSSKDSIEFDIRDYYAIKEIAAEPDLFKLLVHSLCPSIFGHEIVKGSFRLMMFYVTF